MRELCSVSMVFLTGAALAQVPPMMNYQGYLTDPGGAQLTGAYDMAFRIYDGVTAGTKLWEEAHAAVSVSEGLFSVMLGETNPLDASAFAGEAWLQLEVDGEAMDPRVRVVSVGYSFVAAVAHSVAADSVDSAAIKDGSIANADVSGSAAIDVSKLGASGATAGQVLKWSGSKWAPAPDADTDTTYTSGTGLNLAGTEFSVDFSTVATSNHTHDSLGNVSFSGDITFDTPKTRYLTIDHTGFKPRTSSLEYNGDPANGLYSISGGFAYGVYVAPVTLPHGAVVTEMSVQLYDNTATRSVTVMLIRFASGTSRGGSDIMAEVTTSSEGTNWQVLTDTSVLTPTIDNINYFYYVNVRFEVHSIDLKLGGVRIKYTVTEPLP